MKSFPYFLFIVIITFQSCERDQNPLDLKGYFVNPVYNIPSESILASGVKVPWPEIIYPFVYDPHKPSNRNADRPLNELINFCNKIKTRFSFSNLLIDEAKSLYALLDTVIYIDDCHVGMPYPGEPEPVYIDNRDRLMLLKVANDNFEAFYFESCGDGRYYYYFRIETGIINSNWVIKQKKLIEEWRETYPV